MSRRALGVLLAISALANVLLLYRVFDLGVTETFSVEESQYQAKQLTAARKLLSVLAPNATRSEVIKAGEEVGLEVIDKGTDGVYVGNIHFQFAGERLTGIEGE